MTLRLAQTLIQQSCNLFSEFCDEVKLLTEYASTQLSPLSLVIQLVSIYIILRLKSFLKKVCATCCTVTLDSYVRNKQQKLN